MAQFTPKQSARITARLAGEDNTVSIPGVTRAATTSENAVTQINRLYGIVGINVVKSGMTRTITEEAIDDE